MYNTDTSCNNISPLDNRYSSQIRELKSEVSEFAFYKTRIDIELEYFFALLKAAKADVNESAIDSLRHNMEWFDLGSMEKVKDLERETKHDVKAIEYYVKNGIMNRFGGVKELIPHIEKVHLGLTSEDVNNLAYALMFTGALNNSIAPSLVSVLTCMRDIVDETKHIPMLARTHGQSASPTTVGKEMGVFVHRLYEPIKRLDEFRFMGKLNGATGTYAALNIVYPDVDWIQFADEFIRSLGNIEPNYVTTQIEPHDRLVTFCDTLRHINNILIDYCQDMWRYISDGYFDQKIVKNEIGSSAMPHKVNPIYFENAEGNLGLANALLAFFSDKLTKSRLQRDLSDSTVLRNVGTALGYSVLAYKNILEGISRVKVNEFKVRSDLDGNPEVILEACQTILRASGASQPYEKMKSLRGQNPSLVGLQEMVSKLKVKKEIKDRLLEIRPENYIGLSVDVASEASAVANESIDILNKLVKKGGKK